jgi:hypothetical protein
MAELPQRVQATLRKIAVLVSERRLRLPKNDPDLTPARMQLLMRQPSQLVYRFFRAEVEMLPLNDTIRPVSPQLLVNRRDEHSSLFFVILPQPQPEGECRRAPANRDALVVLPFALTAHGYFPQNFA